MYHFIEARYDVLGNYQVLWFIRDYTYEIECRTTKNKIRLVDVPYEKAKTMFNEVCLNKM